MLFADLQEKRRKRKKKKRSFLKSFRSTRSIRQNPLQVCFGAEFGDESVLATPASRSGPKKPMAMINPYCEGRRIVGVSDGA
ncbi:hypothetical protein CEXT_123061 [Caerostris extrusa]|uniref:Uncharacterized protein n=1 Tax=Caerostris extrusa TaxID=172846 RepID=A0AAV4SW78_CAEEX|nr:hypothetical protein CEXT_123061 [Caerostris extrusa]